jgi:uncharacterized SAM-binding protein YcdF (DUF218 family)
MAVIPTIQIVLEQLLLPPGGGLLLILLGLVLARVSHRGSRGLMVFGFLFAVATSLPVVAERLAATLEAPHSRSAIALERADVLVVLGAGRVRGQQEYAGDVPSALALERLRYAVRLHRSSGLPILLSGGRVHPDDRRSEAELMAEVLLADFRITPLWLETQSRNTCGNARGIAEILPEAGLERALVVTHAMHMSRAMACFQTAGIAALPAPMGFRGPRRLSPWVTDFLPNVDAVETSRFALREWAARLATPFRTGG